MNNCNGFDLSQTTEEQQEEELPSHFEEKNVLDDVMEKNPQIVENDLFLSLKLHIDTQCKLNQLNQSRIRSFERFCKYCKRLTEFSDESMMLDPEQFRNEYNRFDRNDRYWRKRIRKLCNLIKSNRYQNPYDALYELFAKIESLERSKKNNHEDQFNQVDQIYIAQSLKVIDPPAPIDDLSSTKITRGRPRKQDSNLIESVASRRSKAKPSKPSKTKALTKITKSQKKDVPKKITIVKQEISVDSNGAPDLIAIPVRKTRKKKQKQIFFCEFEGCKYSSTMRKRIKVHQVVHATERPFPCANCGKTFKSAYCLKIHQNTHNGKRFVCTFEGCPVNYATRGGLRDHIRIVHTKDAPLWKCQSEGCTYSTYDKEYFQIHQKVHSGDRPFKCPECERMFKTRANVWKHRLIHEKEHRYKCQFEGCKYSTNRKEYYNSHQTVHTGHRSHKCPWPDCGEMFKTSSSLWCHKMMHENRRRYKCSFDGCDYACNLPGNIQTHEELVHRKNNKRKRKKQQQQEHQQEDSEPQQNLQNLSNSAIVETSDGGIGGGGDSVDNNNLEALNLQLL